jgi:hypothetical protein
MKLASTLIMLAAASIVGACGGTPECQQQHLYKEAVPGKRIEPLEGMDALPPEIEMEIPKASPNAPPPPGECLDAPPIMRTGAKSS